MGPITLFDKSFIQSLSLDESVWFDHFTLTNVCPVFFAETLADLAKSSSAGRRQEDEVRIIADKFPDMNSGPSAHHADLALSNLLGYEIPMRGQIVLDSGRLVSLDGQANVISDGSPAANAFDRWQDADFDAVEREFASRWREQLARTDMREYPDILSFSKDLAGSPSSLREAQSLVTDFIHSSRSPYLNIEICLSILQIPPSAHARIRSRWVQSGFLPLHDFAPYAAFQLSIILFSIIALKSNLISPARPSTILDIAYLFYLPFCMVFVSSDRFHRTVAPLFLREDQEFVWGPDLKASLQEINLYYSLYPEEEKAKGLHALAPTPPQHVPTLVSALWDRHLPGWRNRGTPTTGKSTQTPPLDIPEKVRRMENAPTISPGPGQLRVDDIQSVTIKRRVRGKKGAWYQVPRDLRSKKPSSEGPEDGA